MEISLPRRSALFAAALMMLVAYVDHPFNWMDSRKAASNLLHACGSAILADPWFRPPQAGRVFREGVWTVVSVFAWLPGWQQGVGPA